MEVDLVRAECFFKEAERVRKQEEAEGEAVGTGEEECSCCSRYSPEVRRQQEQATRRGRVNDPEALYRYMWNKNQFPEISCTLTKAANLAP